MKEQKKQPELRFKGFTDDWEQRKFGELYKKNLERNKDHFSSDRTISIATMRFKKEGNGAAENSLVSYKVLREGDIAFEGHTSKRFAFGRFVLNDIGDGIMSPRFTTLRPTQDMPIKFWKQYIHYEPIMRYPIVNSTKLGTMMNELVVDEFLNQPVLVPELSEQQKIGSFFKQLDNTITLQQRKLELLKKMKRGHLQQMFPSTGQPTPQLRFSKFKGDWKQNKLSGIAKITMGQSPKSENYTDNPNDWILVQGNADIKNGEVYPRVWTTQVTKIAQKGDLLLSVRAPVGDVAKTKYTVVIGRGVASVKGTDFIYYLLEKIKYSGYWERISSGSTFESINSNDVKEAKFYVPKEITEQKKIGNFFQKLDQTITLQQSKVEKLKILKQSYLQKLFP
ncbi:restriction endonuclease subunit S [Latilactobacillus curvatus]|uniref:restriction endonuclease subunit S n=2 Tax=Latilactobacillus curvatus TaxID=28038 RepID=UPI000230EF86|nr:restriction endonuclease subunit S [Latilactobacillus curvatus]EHE86522.1 type I restriction modification DNA specificity domain protein [Latilactobacillus curvatus CRL 705]MCP8860715.1 restriction endonuclease subunit S [Latilactobacillus curvatus]MCP8868625.1 restriction endonuclease subunit S [Latilactobacillus curvatus]MCP8881205.1 restriction endonuclease subunit S [Latilactobacillus curvatus]MCT3358907.1 restriction endonuclease subunit S [Latilactobacillus curvatus]